MHLVDHVSQQLPRATPEPISRALCLAVDAWGSALGDRLRSLVLFGSVARGTATPQSDIDLIAVVESLPRSLRDRRQPLLEIWQLVRHTHGLMPVEWNLIVKTPEEAAFHTPLYLDIVDDGILLLDRDRFFENILTSMRLRMRELGSRRVFLPNGSWYWDLKPDFRPGDVVEI